MTIAETTRILSPGAAARRLDVSYQTIRNYVAKGLLRAVQTPLGLCIEVESVDALIARTSREAAAMKEAFSRARDSH